MANRTKIKLISFALSAVFILTACGQKLPLYLEPASNNTTQDSGSQTDSSDQGKD